MLTMIGYFRTPLYRPVEDNAPVTIARPEAPMGKEPADPADLRDAPRRNLFLAAAIESDAVSGPVRIRNLSGSGAMLEGAALPACGEQVVLRRPDLQIRGVVVWSAGSRCGVRFDGNITVSEWVHGKRSGNGAALRDGAPAPPGEAAGPFDPASVPEDLDRRLAEEIAFVQRLLDSIAGVLADERLLVQRHPGAVQNFDLAGQILWHVAAILRSDNRAAAIHAIGIDDLRARLTRKPVFKS